MYDLFPYFEKTQYHEVKGDNKIDNMKTTQLIRENFTSKVVGHFEVVANFQKYFINLECKKMQLGSLRDVGAIVCSSSSHVLIL